MLLRSLRSLAHWGLAQGGFASLRTLPCSSRFAPSPNPDRGALRRLPPSPAERLKSRFLEKGGRWALVGMGVSRRLPPEAPRSSSGRLVGATAPVLC